MADGICGGNVDRDEPPECTFDGADTIPDCICGTVDFWAFGKLLRDCIGLEPTLDVAALFCTFGRG